MKFIKFENQLTSLGFVLETWIFFLKCSSFDDESEYDIQKYFLTRNILQNSFFSTHIAEKPRFSRNPSSEGFGKNFLETKRKSTSRNPYKPEDNSIRSAVLEIT